MVNSECKVEVNVITVLIHYKLNALVAMPSIKNAI